MTILSEQERLINNEVVLINDTNQHNTPASWGTVVDEGNITLAAESLVVIRLQLYSNASTTYARVKIGGVPVLNVQSGAAYYVPFGTLISLAAGTYDVLIEGLNSNGAVNYIQVGTVSFNDVAQRDLAAYSSGITKTVAARNTPAGVIVQATFFAHVLAYTASAATHLENIGDNLTNGVSILVDGAQVNWSETTIEDPAYHGICGNIALPYSTGTSHTITISKRNSNTVVEISVIACPWILSSQNYSPFTLTFPQGSTVYAILNPLYEDTSKFVGVGKSRGVSFGAATDYYNSTSGTGLISYSFCVDVPDYTQVSLFVSGLGGCIEVVSVDLRSVI